MKLFIPPLGYQFKLSKDWIFHLHIESRNKGLLVLAWNSGHLWTNQDDKIVKLISHNTTEAKTWLWWGGGSFTYEGLDAEKRHYEKYKTAFTIPEGTVLKIDRIYIRQGLDDFDSVTFRIVSSPDKTLAKKRFWAKLTDTNQIEFEEIPTN